MRRGIVRRQIKLDGDSFPKTIGVFEDAVSGNVASQDRHRIHVHLRKVFSEPALSGPAPTVARKQIATLWNAARDRSHPRLRVSSAANGGCIRGKDRSWCEWVFHRPCCCPFYFCQTSPGNPRSPASLRPSARKSHREKCGRIASDGTAHRQHCACRTESTTKWIRFASDSDFSIDCLMAG